ncbi:LVIVD repeat-containing protein [Arthrobacter sp. TMS2-4]
MKHPTKFLLSATLCTFALSAFGLTAAAAHPDGQHGFDEGHLAGTGASGELQLLDIVGLTDTPDLIADVTVSPDGNTAYLLNWGEPDCAGPETGGQTSPDAGVYVVDISNIETDPTSAEQIGFIPAHQDTRPGEGLQVIELTTASFSGDVLVVNNEQCGKNGKGGVSLWDVSDPLKPKKLSESFGDRAPGDSDANEIHSVFAWDAGDRAYVVVSDNAESTDVDIFDITKPNRPRLVAEYDLNDFGVQQPELGLTESFLHDMVVKEIDGRFIMLLSYWDGGYVLLDVTDPANTEFLADTDFADVDPQLLESLGIELTPEGNAHQAEFTIDNEFFIGTDEDFDPYRTDDLRITSGPGQGDYPSNIVSGGQGPAALEDLTLNGPVVYGGYGCPGSAALPTPESIPGYLDSLAAGEETILVLQRGPAGDPSAPEEACFPGDKAHEAALAGWDAVLFVNHHSGEAAGGEPFCGSGGFTDEIVAICTTHTAFHTLFTLEPQDPASWAYPENLAIGTVGEDIEVGSTFDGWGYVHLFDPETMEDLDTYAIPESQEPAYAFGYGDLSVHEVAVDPQDPSLAYLSYYSGGMRALQIQCGGVPYDPATADTIDKSTCELVEVGSYLDPAGNDFWGVETFIGEDGKTYILGSDRDSGLWIFTNP